jgi:hypothetical protein
VEDHSAGLPVHQTSVGSLFWGVYEADGLSSEITGTRYEPLRQIVAVAGRIRSSPGGIRMATRSAVKRTRSCTVNR